MAEDTQSPPPPPSAGNSGSPASARPEPVNVALAETPPAPPPSPSAGDAPAVPDAGTPVETGDPITQLAAMAEAGNPNRLPPGDEERATRLMRDCIRLGSDGIAAALAAMPRLPWILAVRAIEGTWQEAGADFRTQIIEGLGKIDTESGYRLRLSVARALARSEPAVAAKVAADTCGAMWKEDIGLAPEHSKLIGNVFIGRGKPWVVQLPLKDISESEARALVSSVVFSAFNINNPPITQLSILRYAAGRFGNLHPSLIGLVAKGVGRWGGKWQSALQREVTDLPEPILAAMKAAQPAESRRPAPEARPPAGAQPEEEAEESLPPELADKLQIAAESADPAAVEVVNQEINAWREARRIARLEALDAEDEDDEEDEDEGDEEDEVGGTQENEGVRPDDDSRRGRDRRGRDRRDRPVYVPRDQEGKGPAFNLGAALKQIDNYVAGLRNDLVAAQARLRRAEEDGRRGRRESVDRPVLSHEEANLSPDELRRLVIQLESRAAELKARVEELTADSESRAVAMETGGSEAAPDPVTQLRTLLALKLQDDYADFLALEKESPDFIVQQHYRSLIRHVFQILADEKVQLRVPEEPVVIPPLLPPIPG